MKCPKCGFEQSEGIDECINCRIIFSKWKEVQSRMHAASEANKGNEISTTPDNLENSDALSDLNSLKKIWMTTRSKVGIFISGTILFFVISILIKHSELFVIATICIVFETIIFWLAPQLTETKKKKLMKGSHTMLMVFILVAIFQYPYIFTIGKWAPEIPLAQASKNLNKYGNRKIKVSGTVIDKQWSNFNIGTDNILILTLRNDKAVMCTSLNMKGLDKQPNLDEKIQVTGSVIKYGDNHLRFIGSNFEVLDKKH